MFGASRVYFSNVMCCRGGSVISLLEVHADFVALRCFAAALLYMPSHTCSALVCFPILRWTCSNQAKTYENGKSNKCGTGVPAPLLPGTAYQDGAGAPECKGERARGGRGAGEHGVLLAGFKRPSCCWCVIVSPVCHG